MSSQGGVAVTVVGSANLDIVVGVDRFPAPGETVLGADPVEIAGGKGLNQAVAAAREAAVAFVGCVGEDDAGRVLVSRLADAGVDTRHVHRTATPTGRAFIQVAPDGENSIVVAAAANQRLTGDQVTHALEDQHPGAVLAQLEVPLDSVLSAARWARDHGARFVLNLSPVRSVPEEVLRSCDPLVVNATEGAQVLGVPEGSSADEVARGLTARATSVVVTDGPRGAYVGAGGEVEHVPGSPAEAVDTTGAGDEFAGTLAAALAAGETLAAAARAGNLAAARVVTVPRSRR